MMRNGVKVEGVGQVRDCPHHVPTWRSSGDDGGRRRESAATEGRGERSWRRGRRGERGRDARTSKQSLLGPLHPLQATASSSEMSAYHSVLL